MVSATMPELKAAFTEWERRYREDPERFFSEQAKLADSCESYGGTCGPYFAKILKTMRGDPNEQDAKTAEL